MSDLTVRAAEPGDVHSIAEIDKACFSAPWSEESFRVELEENTVAFYLVGEIDGEVAGYAGLWWVGDEGHITNVAVHPKYRGKHIATCILDCLIDYCENEGMRSFTLEVRPSNDKAIELYQKFAFVDVGRRPGYYEDNHEDAIIMWRVIDDSGMPVLDRVKLQEIMIQRGKE
ncbi:MAG: ribosomal protein S18-alanine N-acetyltransferase [Eubacteriaceae bacterium]|jgi:ribosomal-protein-alanine N-acetyltransferase|nr:ribosomal protein S18-alanine N-acetyltransferase [Eubacteriaceae bacterium]